MSFASHEPNHVPRRRIRGTNGAAMHLKRTSAYRPQTVSWADQMARTWTLGKDVRVEATNRFLGGSNGADMHLRTRRFHLFFFTIFFFLRQATIEAFISLSAPPSTTTVSTRSCEASSAPTSVASPRPSTNSAPSPAHRQSSSLFQAPPSQPLPRRSSPEASRSSNPSGQAPPSVLHLRPPLLLSNPPSLLLQIRFASSTIALPCFTNHHCPASTSASSARSLSPESGDTPEIAFRRDHRRETQVLTRLVSPDRIRPASQPGPASFR